MTKFICILVVVITLLAGCSSPQSSVLYEDTENTAEITSSALATLEITDTPSPTFSPTASPSPTATPKPLLLEGVKIGIDPGHQASGNSNLEQVSPYYDKQKTKVSLGATGTESGVREHIFNLELSLMLQKALEEEGAIVVMTRTTDDVNISNKQRAQMMNDAECDFWIRIHANYSSKDYAAGICMLTPRKRSVSTEIYETSRLLSALIQQSVISATGAKDNGLQYRGDITGFNWSRIPVTLIECGYLSNAKEDLLLQSEEYKSLLVEGIVQGMIDYVNGEDIPEKYS